MGLTVAELAKVLRVSPSTVSRITQEGRELSEIYRARLRAYLDPRPPTRRVRGDAADQPRLGTIRTPLTGRGLVRLLDQLAEKGISRRTVARGTRVSIASLQGLCRLPDGLPRRFVERLHEFLRRHR